MAEISWPWQYNFPPFFTYIAEGNAHIVLEIMKTDYVVRLIKENGQTVDLPKVKRAVEFVNSVMMPLLGTHDIYPNEIIEMTADDIIKLSKQLLQYRPEHRRCKSVLSKYAIKAPNLSIVRPKFCANYCIEIKPKEGYICSSLRKYSKCYYCLKQLLKLNNHEVRNISYYCPLDLFSGDKNRMKLALRSLIDNPQNNFKLFKNCQIVYNENSPKTDFFHILKDTVFKDNINVFLDFIVAILLSDGRKHFILDNVTELNSQHNRISCNENNILQPNAYLYKLLYVQKLSVTNVFDAKTVPYEDTEYVPLILEHMNAHNIDLKKNTDHNKFFNTCNPAHLALISAVVRDCSLMISFSHYYDDDVPYIFIGDEKISYKISVTDLEPKSTKTLFKRQETEQKLIDIYEKSLNTEKDVLLCKIQPHTETRNKQLEAWQQLIADYLKATKQSTIDIRESQNSPLFNNASIHRKLSQESILIILEHMAKTGRAAPVDKSRNVWEVYWHSLDEWGNIIYTWASNNGLNNSVCTIFELREGENTVDEEFHGLDVNVLIKALKALETKGRCELIEFDENQGVKFF